VHVFTKAGNTDLLPFAMNHSSPREVEDRFGQTALHVSAMAGRPDAVRWLLLAGAAYLPDAHGSFPLHLAVRETKWDAVKMMVRFNCQE
jgi:ankyrin repeat protein